MTEAQVAGLSALVGGAILLAGMFLGGWLNERWAAQREQRDEERRNRQAIADRLREDRLDSVDQTRRGLAATLSYLSARAAGNLAAVSIAVGLDTYPRFDISLIDNAEAQRHYRDVAADLAAREPGAGFTSGDREQVNLVQQMLQMVLEDQRQRALEDKELGHVDKATAYGVTPQVAAAYEVLGIVFRTMGINAPSQDPSTGE